MKNYNYYYVYRITNLITGMHYYGDRACECHPSEDLGYSYFSSFSNKFFKEDQIQNPNHYKYKIIKIFETNREDAKELETFLHEKFDVKNHPKFINRANQTSKKFDTTGKSFKHKETTKKLIGKNTRKSRLENGSYLTGAKKGAKTKESIIDNNGDSLHIISARKAAKTRKSNIMGNKTLQEIVTEKAKETMLKKGKDGLNGYQKQGEKLSKKLSNNPKLKEQIRLNSMESRRSKTINDIPLNKHTAMKVAETKKKKYENVIFHIFNSSNKLECSLNYYDFKNRIIDNLPYSRFKNLMEDWKKENGFEGKAIIEQEFTTKTLNILKGKNTIFNGWYLVKEVIK